MFTIYIIINKVNNKCYVGATSRDVSIRWLEHHKKPNKLMSFDVDKLGWGSFDFTILEEGVSFKSVSEREIFYQEKYNCFAPKGYNQTRGWFSLSLPSPQRDYPKDCEHLWDFWDD